MISARFIIAELRIGARGLGAEPNLERLLEESGFSPNVGLALFRKDC